MINYNKYHLSFDVQLFDKLLVTPKLIVFSQFERVSVYCPHIIRQQQLLQVCLQRPKLKIVRSVVVRKNGDTVIRLKRI